MNTPRKHIQMDVSDKFNTAIEEIMCKYGASKTHTITRLAGIGKFVLDAQERGDTITIADHAYRFEV